MLSKRIRVDEAGTSLIEVLVTSVILGIALMIIYQVLGSVQTAVSSELTRSETNDTMRLAVHQIERQVRSGNLFYDPSVDNDPANGIYPGMTLRIYTQADGSVVAYPNRCVQWRIFEETLQHREWSPAWAVDGYVTGWRTVADSVVNDTLSPEVPAFTLDTSDTKYGQRLLQIALVTNASPEQGPPLRVESSITGRNTGYGFPTSVCATLPPYA